MKTHRKLELAQIYATTASGVKTCASQACNYGCDDTRDADADGDGDGDGSNDGGGSGIHRSNTQHVVAARHSGTAAVPSLLRDNVPYRMFWCTIRWRNSSPHVRTLAPDNLGLGGSELAPRVNWSSSKRMHVQSHGAHVRNYGVHTYYCMSIIQLCTICIIALAMGSQQLSVAQPTTLYTEVQSFSASTARYYPDTNIVHGCIRPRALIHGNRSQGRRRETKHGFGQGQHERERRETAGSTNEPALETAWQGASIDPHDVLLKGKAVRLPCPPWLEKDET
ncbi:hypothetical protein X797_007260 [Metarhizium robertsii]|uniref:Uncharacterized protein n=1 Tax=Metarhizium robertsii TaxID=568076 RepID=A0A014N1R9_9HYPO|nr:hypothetical protein X797_007260 [Metarhizium robertsii]